MLAIDWQAVWAVTQNVIDAIGVFLQSPIMVRAYAIGIGGVVLSASVWWAYQQLAVLRDIQIEDFELRIPGPKPTRQETIARQIARRVVHEKTTWKARFIAFGQLVICGYLVPVALLWAGGYFYSWFDSSHSALWMCLRYSTSTLDWS